MGYRQVPVLGVNLGRLGFLADLRPDELRTCFPQILAGEYRLTRHLMYECVVDDGQTSRTFLGLNEVAFHVDRHAVAQASSLCTTVPAQTGRPSNAAQAGSLCYTAFGGILDLELSLDGDVVAQFSGDGLLISTPIGSTAHNLSAGGPILGQELQSFVITPLCPHGLTYRPVVESADRQFSVTLGPRRRAGLAGHRRPGSGAAFQSAPRHREASPGDV